MSAKIKFQIVQDGKKFSVRDEADTVNYGTFDTRAEAEQCVEDWIEYYQDEP